MSTTSSSFRGTGLEETFASNFKKSDFYKIVYKQNINDVIVGIRDGYINLYHNCNSIAKISASSKEFKAEISKYYLDIKGGGTKKIKANELVQNLNLIKTQSNKRNQLEKQAQEQLYIKNNLNKNSNWFCIDVEYTRSGVDWRYDIIAVSKDSEHRVALIELKYGNMAIGGNSGIRTHIKDFYNFFKKDADGGCDFDKLKPEIISIIEKLIALGVDVPDCLHELKETQLYSEPQFYIITLNNNPKSAKASSPEMTMSGYLFSDKRWGCKKISKDVKDKGDYFQIINNDKNFNPIFYFSESTLPNLQIDDILNEKFYKKVVIE
ncbi:MAG: hypothetical protein MJ010_06875 [Paludibacteraceae bacterium]|nr:hypothetical protein [Paludibacteraceae bacterium]